MIPCNDGTPCGFIELIRKQFLCAFKVNNVDWEGIIKHLSGLSYADCIHHQDSLISATVESPIVTKYPVKKSYKRAFLKKLVTEVEKHDIAHPAIYDLYVNLLQSESEKSVEHFKHFVISPDKIITVKESESIISKGTTGLAVWQGGIALTEWAFQHSHLFRGKNILELGCGIGFTGISLCLSEVSPDSYVFTDYHPDVLETLNLNIKINSSEGAVDQLGSTKVKVTALDWEEIDNFSLETSFYPNVVLAADTVSSVRNLKKFHRRPGRLYRISGSSKALVKSKYFTEKKVYSEPAWIPPRSPYALIQEDLYSNPWQLLIATVFLTKTTAQRAIPQIHKFLAEWPNPRDLLKASFEEVLSFFAPLGLDFLRTETVIRFTREYLEKEWRYPIELHGIGKYGNDSYRIFCVKEWREVTPDDIPLTMYRNWLLENADELGID